MLYLVPMLSVLLIGACDPMVCPNWGPLQGYLGAEPLRDARGSAGNWGTLDQRQAMRFVRDHVSAFGGDPDRVLLAGTVAWT